MLGISVLGCRPCIRALMMLLCWSCLLYSVRVMNKVVLIFSELRTCLPSLERVRECKIAVSFAAGAERASLAEQGKQTVSRLYTVR